MSKSKDEMSTCCRHSNLRSLPAEVHGMRLSPEETRKEAIERVPQRASAALAEEDDQPTFATASENYLSPGPNQDEAGRNFWADGEGLQPSSLLNKQATNGKYSLQNILSISDRLHLVDPKSASDLPEDDPISKGIVSFHIATSLFENFMKSFNPFICVLDPALYTFRHVRERSSFLLTVMLAASSKVYNPALHPEIHKYSEQLLNGAFAQGAKSPEVIQAILLSTYWKQPEDTRSWSLIGYTIRLCMELGWHKFKPNSDADDSAASELERGMSLQTGKPWMIERSDFLESVNTWYKHPMATSNDATLAALVTLRLATADIIDIFCPLRPAPYRGLEEALGQLKLGYSVGVHDPVLITSSQSNDILSWCPSLTSISSPIGASLVDTEAFWITYTSAIEMLQLVSHHSVSPLLSFAHDSVHVMTAYSAAFLIKLLLSVNKSIRQEFETAALETINTVARVFADQSTPPNYACALQVKFLHNVVQEYARACRGRYAHEMTEATTGAAQQYQVGQQPPSQQDLSRREGPSQHEPFIENTARHQRSAEDASDSIRNTSCGQQLVEDVPFRADGMASALHEAAGQASSPNRDMTDDEWAAIFMNAGFDIEAGVFFQ
ncbi:hypothetical protein EDD36DRAFT_423657 [Exophiala viscosa]|uniref:Transcription factor domain-containing protein n=1 Tax=Exophiala viscosa TaxID=2486360 RepID=A0AAN6DKT5_9EURO|nr:hypothetical protein EDD36DRAFT_423657 [Exophiala viscosa]